MTIPSMTILPSSTGTEEVALWMIRQGYITGHGDTLTDLLGELVHQVHANALLEAHNAAQASSEHCCVPGREDALLTAHEIREAKNAYLDGMGQQGNAERKEKLSQVLHDNATDIANSLEAFALAYARNAIIEDCASVADKYWAREVASQIRALTQPPAMVKPAAGHCTCQDEHRRGYCTEPGCPYAVTSQERA